MLISSRLSRARAGFSLLKHLTPPSRSISNSVAGTRLQRPRCLIHHLLSVALRCTEAFNGAIFENHHKFCTSANKPSGEGKEQKETISVTFVSKDGEEKQIRVPVGMSMLEAAHENDIELEGACEGSLACSTCHVIVMDVDYYNKIEEPADEENDMLDLAFGLTETSRLGCQVIAKPELDGIRLAIPAATRNFAVDGYVPKPH